MQRHLKLIPLSAALALVAAGAFAQTPAPAATSSTPAAVGVSPQTAAEANQKAVPRSDTGTVVRTSPSPADKARSAMDDKPAATTSGTAATTTSMDNNNARRAPMRRARADRN